MYRGRFAPSPTGPLHFGSLVAAAGSFLEARSQSGLWLLRIDDIDTPRVIPAAADHIMRTLERYGLFWDGTVSYQSDYLDDYAAALQTLRQTGRVYRCSCSRKEIAASARAGRSGRIYPGFCRNRPLRARSAYALRLLTDNTPIGFNDRIQGRVEQRLASEVGDFVIRRTDGLFAYQLAVVIDDAREGVNAVVRGSDLLDSTPRQIYLQRLLGLSTPEYAHLPLVVDRDGHKLSKQTGAAAIAGSGPVAVIFRVLQVLGQTPPAELKTASVAEIWTWASRSWCRRHVPKVYSISLTGEDS